MPSTRMLADQFSISRITVLLTYERLIAEGLLTTVPARRHLRQPRTALATNTPRCEMRQQYSDYSRFGRWAGRQAVSVRPLARADP
jgi:DNA-binding transcriptional MocR family regulator